MRQLTVFIQKYQTRFYFWCVYFEFLLKYDQFSGDQQLILSKTLRTSTSLQDISKCQESNFPVFRDYCWVDNVWNEGSVCISIPPGCPFSKNELMQILCRCGPPGGIFPLSLGLFVVFPHIETQHWHGATQMLHFLDDAPLLFVKFDPLQIFRDMFTQFSTEKMKARWASQSLFDQWLVSDLYFSHFFVFCLHRLSDGGTESGVYS